MLPLGFWEHQTAVKNVYARCVSEVCEHHGLTRVELDVLLFLANNPEHDTARDIVELRYLHKSQVSMALKNLEERGFLRGEYAAGNRKTVHLRLLEGAAQAAVADGRAAQEKFVSILLRGLEPEEIRAAEAFNQRVWENIDHYLRGE